jgi:hypothetical protein
MVERKLSSTLFECILPSRAVSPVRRVPNLIAGHTCRIAGPDADTLRQPKLLTYESSRRARLAA